MFRLLLLFAIAVPAAAQTVYKTVEDGVVTFSDTPPAEGSAEEMELQVPPAANDALLQERLEAMRESTDRMAADRRAREQHRAELRALNAPAPTPEIIVREQPVAQWYGGYWPSYRPPGRPRPPHRPGHPGFRPPPAQLPEPPPGWSVIKPANEQLMRPRYRQRQ